MAAPRIFCGTVTGQLMTLGGTGEGITPPVVSIARRPDRAAVGPMSPQVQIDAIVEGMEMQSDDMSSYLHRPSH
jgi:hypothetical protein